MLHSRQLSKGRGRVAATDDLCFIPTGLIVSVAASYEFIAGPNFAQTPASLPGM